MGKANDEKKQVNMDESTAAREERDRDIRALMALMEEGDLSALRFDDGNVKIELERNHGPLSQAALPLMAERVGQAARRPKRARRRDHWRPKRARRGQRQLGHAGEKPARGHVLRLPLPRRGAVCEGWPGSAHRPDARYRGSYEDDERDHCARARHRDRSARRERRAGRIRPGALPHRHSARAHKARRAPCSRRFSSQTVAKSPCA